MPKLYEERDDDHAAFVCVQVCDDGEEELGVPYSKTATYRKKYADKYKLRKQQEKAEEKRVSDEYARDARFDMLAHSAARSAEKVLVEVVEYEVYVEGARVMCAFFTKIPDAPIAVLELPDYEKYERAYYVTELTKQICRAIRGK